MDAFRGCEVEVEAVDGDEGDALSYDRRNPMPMPDDDDDVIPPLSKLMSKPLT